MTKQLIIVVLQLLLVKNIFAQDEIVTKKKHSLYAEVFGQGFSGSLNYDLMFNRDRKWKNSFTAGVVAIPRAFDFGDGAYLGLPVSYNWLYGGKRNFLELGVGLTTQIGEGSAFQKRFSTVYTYVTPKIGYRFQAYKSGLFFRATITPHVALINTDFGVRSGSLNTSSYLFKNVMNLDYRAFPWFGLSLGYTFNSK